MCTQLKIHDQIFIYKSMFNKNRVPVPFSNEFINNKEAPSKNNFREIPRHT